MVFLFLNIIIFLSYCMVSADVICDFTPIQLAVRDVSLPQNGIARGIAVAVGTPPKDYAFMPKLDVNNTWMYDTGNPLCGKAFTFAYCNVHRGGIFNGAYSTSFFKTPDVVAAGGVPESNATQLGAAIGGSDTVTLNANAILPKFPIGFPRKDWENGLEPQNFIGLDFNSTLLSWLKSAGNIGSRTYSIWWGLNGATGTSKMDGNVVLGGYDSAKVKGTKYEKHMSPRTGACTSGMLVEITDISLNFLNGTNSSMIPAATINACIIPAFPGVMSIPDNPFYTDFETLSETKRTGTSVGINYGGAVYGLGSAFTGSLSITIASTLTITISNDQLLLPDQTLDANGNQQYSTTSSEILINPLKTNSVPMLGRQFLTAAYLTVNQDTEAFTLWQANPTTLSHLLPIKDLSCSPSPAITNGTEGAGATNGTTGTTGNTTTGAADNSNQNHNPVPSVTDIIAIAVSGSVLVALIIAAILFCRKSRNNKQKKREDSKRMSFFDRGVGGNRSEVHGDSAPQQPSGEFHDDASVPHAISQDLKYEMWANEEENVFEMSAPAASWTPLGQQRQHDLPPEAPGAWPLDRKRPLIGELPAELPAG